MKPLWLRSGHAYRFDNVVPLRPDLQPTKTFRQGHWWAIPLAASVTLLAIVAGMLAVWP